MIDYLNKLNDLSNGITVFFIVTGGLLLTFLAIKTITRKPLKDETHR